jgi:hypothetical protein
LVQQKIRASLPQGANGRFLAVISEPRPPGHGREATFDEV